MNITTRFIMTGVSIGLVITLGLFVYMKIESGLLSFSLEEVITRNESGSVVVESMDDHLYNALNARGRTPSEVQREIGGCNGFVEVLGEVMSCRGI